VNCSKFSNKKASPSAHDPLRGLVCGIAGGAQPRRIELEDQREETVAQRHVSRYCVANAPDAPWSPAPCLAAASPFLATSAVTMAIYATSTYAQHSPGIPKGCENARTRNPLRDALALCRRS
jgi:hypothetical protein